MSGVRTPMPLKSMEPSHYSELETAVRKLERSLKDMQDVEFTVQVCAKCPLLSIHTDPGNSGNVVSALGLFSRIGYELLELALRAMPALGQKQKAGSRDENE